MKPRNVGRLALGLITSLAYGGPGHAAGSIDLCRIVSNRLWFDVATEPLQQQTPLAALTTAASGIQAAPKNDGSLVEPGRAIVDTLKQHRAPNTLTDKLRDLQHVDVMRLGDSQVWLLDQVGGTLSCHIVLAVLVSPDAAAREVALPGTVDPSNLCALSALTAVTIDGAPALWIEQSGAYSASLSRSTITIAALRDGAFAPPCDVVIDYAVAFHASHAFCDGLDCASLIPHAEVLATRWQRGETAESLGDGMIAPALPQGETDYQRMVGLLGAETQAGELPTFGALIDTPYTTFSDQIIFPFRSGGGQVYLARLGHGGLGWRQTADTLLALYRLHDGQMTPAAGVYLEARRTGVSWVTVK